MIDRLMTRAAILAIVCGAAMLTPAVAQEDLITEEIGGEVTIDDEVLQDGDGEIAVEDGEVVPYGPEDCIECNGVPLTAEVVDRPVGETFRGDLAGQSVARSDREKPEPCDAARISKMTGICR